MRFSHLLLPAALVLAGFSTVSAMNNADLVKMKKADLSDETIILSIQKENADYDTSAEGLIELKKQGISEAIIQKIVARGSGAPVAEAPVAPVGGLVQSELFSVESPSVAPPIIQVVVGQDYFTRFSLFEEEGKYDITNYSRGILVPINTPVKLLSLSGKNILLKRLDDGKQITVVNKQEYSKKPNADVGALILSAEKTPIEKLVPALQTAIMSGELRKGMTKEQAILARGYPPAHKTPSTDSDKWVYWSSKFVQLTVVFSNGRLTEGRGLF